MQSSVDLGDSFCGFTPLQGSLAHCNIPRRVLLYASAKTKIVYLCTSLFSKHIKHRYGLTEKCSLQTLRALTGGTILGHSRALGGRT